jgi:hypothetical protein
VIRLVFGLVWAVDAALKWRSGSGFAAAIETVLALAVITGFARKATFAFGAVYAPVLWAVDGFGGAHHAGASDLGTAVIYSLVFVALLVIAAQAGPDPFSFDSFLERRITWWWRVAEVRFHPATPLATPPRPRPRRRHPARPTLVPIPVDLLDDDWPA